MIRRHEASHWLASFCDEYWRFSISDFAKQFGKVFFGFSHADCLLSHFQSP
jgi:hypothetical protein